jgi:hypothetical protein
VPGVASGESRGVVGAALRTRPGRVGGIRTVMARPKPSNGSLRAALRGDPARLRIRTREGERRKQQASRARRRGAERRELE